MTRRRASIFLVLIGLFAFGGFSSMKKTHSERTTALKIISRTVTKDPPGFHNALYTDKKGKRLISGNLSSEDNGRTWNKYTIQPDFNKDLPYGYRRNRITSVRDPYSGRIITLINSLDTPGLDPKINEPKVALSTYYLRYTVSADGGKSWLFEEPVIEEGHTEKNPIRDVVIGKNSVYLGDLGCIPVVTRNHKILVPVQATLADSDGNLLNPGGGYTYTDVMVLIGTWTDRSKINWKVSRKVEGDPKRSTRGMIEPTMMELKDGRILMVMRGSNGGKLDPKDQLPSYKWYSISNEGGETWSKPEPWCFEDGESFYSPSSMSTLFKHSSGRCFWVGNLSKENCQDNLPRWPLVIAEVNTDNLKLIRSSLLTVDTRKEEDLQKGRLDLSHFTLLEDRETKEIILTYPRNTNAYKNTEWVTVKLAL